VLICACVAGHAAFASGAANAAGTLKVVFRLPSAPVATRLSEPTSTSLSSALDGLMMAASPLVSTITMRVLAGRLPAGQEIVIVEPGVTSSTLAVLGEVAALLYSQPDAEGGIARPVRSG
jgi:hypothetical protein